MSAARPTCCESVYFAAFRGHENCIRYWVEVEGQNINLHDEVQYYTPLCHAVENNHMNCVRLICEMNANIHYEYNKRAIIIAAKKGLLECLQFLIHWGININYHDSDEYSALHIATLFNNYECVEFLIKNGADINLESRYDGTALHIASEKGYMAIVKLLLENNAEFETSSFWLSPAGVAACYDQIEILKYYIDHGWDKKQDEYTKHIFIAAARGGALKCINYLLDIGYCDVNDLLDKRVALVEANSQPKCIQLLIDRGADVNCNKDIFSPLYAAVCHHNKESVEILCKHGANVFEEKFDNTNNLEIRQVIQNFREKYQMLTLLYYMQKKVSNSPLYDRHISRIISNYLVTGAKQVLEQDEGPIPDLPDH